MRTERRFRIAWKPYLAELGVTLALEVLPTDSQELAGALNELFAILIVEDEVEGWRPPALAEPLSRFTEPLTGLH